MKLRFSLIVIAIHIAVVVSLLLGATQIENIWRWNGEKYEKGLGTFR
jgi:iron complex transport system permease protein